MFKMSPLKIKVENKTHLRIIWQDNSETMLPLKYLRNECPCANCKGETILLKTYRPPATQTLSGNSYLIKNIQIVGDYAIQITWNDGHNTGIYSWEYLKKLESGLSTNGTDNTKQNYEPLL
jgi:DUF971 family protein